MRTTSSLVQDPGRVSGLAKQIAAGDLSPVALIERYLDRIEEVDEAVQAWRHVDAEGARLMAEQCEAEARAGHLRGPLHGIPFAVKDTIDVEGITSLCGSLSMKGSPKATADAAIVLALRAAGAIPLGKVHTTEFAFFDPSPARNPHNTAHTPGGSSSGSAAAVAAGMVPLALGTQTIASVNRPASYCGIGAFKPSTGSILNYGVASLSPVFDTVGFHGYEVEDALDAFDAVRPAFLAGPRAGNVPRRVVLLEDRHLDDADPEAIAASERLGQAIREASFEVIKLKSPVSCTQLFDLQQTAMYYEMGRTLRALLDRPTGTVGKNLLAGIEKGKKIGFETYQQAVSGIAALRATLLEMLGNDVVLWPSAPAPAPEGLASTGNPRYIAPWTAVGGPIVSIPAGRSTSGLPLGCIVAGRPGSDSDLCAFARKLAPVARAAFWESKAVA